jgi:hypothetical protein
MIVLIMLFTTSFASASSDASRNFIAPLSGREEVPVRDTNATGVAHFKLSKDGTELEYKLIVANIENVHMAHIHMAPVGTNGGIVVWLYPPAPPAMHIPGRTNGVLAEGTITAANLVGALAGQPLSALIDAMRAGNTYVNVHTDDMIAPPNTGPGDFPGGEIRGQIR